MSLADREKAEIDILLAEYQACHTNRNHYDNLRWTIGSIFIASSLALFGISFMNEVRLPIEVIMMASFSLLLIVIWYGYNQHVNPYVLASIKRLHEIELELYKMCFDMKLHKSVWEREKKELIKPRGAWITYFLFLIVLGAWFLRLILAFQEVEKTIWMLIFYCVLACGIYIMHMKIFNWENLREDDIKKIIQKREKIKHKKTKKRLKI